MEFLNVVHKLFSPALSFLNGVKTVYVMALNIVVGVCKIRRKISQQVVWAILF